MSWGSERVGGGPDFDGAPLIVGSFVGLRAFQLDPDGWLTGCTYSSYQMPLPPAYAEAECQALEWRRAARGYPTSYAKALLDVAEALGADAQQMEAARRSLDMARPPTDEEHEVAGLRCTCGFYGYHDGSNVYATGQTPTDCTCPMCTHSQRVPAVVEGFGRVTIGNRGWRASKMRLIAIYGVTPNLPPLAEQYGVPFYGTIREAVEAHPLTPAPERPEP